MAITVTRTDLSGIFVTLDGRLLSRCVLNITGLTPSASNTVPHGLRPPQVVGLNCWGGSGTSLVTLDSTKGLLDKGGNSLGYDATNLYVLANASATSAQATIEYGRV